LIHALKFRYCWRLSGSARAQLAALSSRQDKRI